MHLSLVVSQGDVRPQQTRLMIFARESKCSSKTTCRIKRPSMRKSVYLKIVRPLHLVTLKNKFWRSKKFNVKEIRKLQKLTLKMI